MTGDLQRCVDFLQQMIRTLSLPGHEGELASLVANEMRDLDYDEVRIDEVGNVLGRIEGRGQAPDLMFNTHLDHVDVGDPAAWPHPPFGGEIHDDKVWGRGAVDIKGPMAAQVVGVARLLRGERPPGDVWVTAVVQEEVSVPGTWPKSCLFRWSSSENPATTRSGEDTVAAPSWSLTSPVAACTPVCRSGE
jgi:acetylornithine deacetylase/succinyl-diaminopimelate desuccinylase-like protein